MAYAMSQIRCESQLFSLSNPLLKQRNSIQFMTFTWKCHYTFRSILYIWTKTEKKNVNIVQLNWIVFCMNISEEWYVFTHTPLVLYLHVSRMLFTMAAGIQIKWKSTLRQCKKKEREMNVRALTTRRRRLVTMLWSIQWKRGLNWGKKKKRKLFDHVSLDKHWFFFHYYLLFCF